MQPSQLVIHFLQLPFLSPSHKNTPSTTGSQRKRKESSTLSFVWTKTESPLRSSLIDLLLHVLFFSLSLSLFYLEDLQCVAQRMWGERVEEEEREMEFGAPRNPLNPICGSKFYSEAGRNFLL
ncbi:hypothetical protein NPIL_459281 [Nephila pilipes]|uniref:Uncharacterized protein n=1 Tax=Nephila pilipes TaxID=299642 RepID=A0A8X6QZJ9_NEPPI|nr:hypothetical protein NPIL_459281 [Nephila pilipes]